MPTHGPHTQHRQDTHRFPGSRLPSSRTPHSSLEHQSWHLPGPLAHSLLSRQSSGFQAAVELGGHGPWEEGLPVAGLRTPPSKGHPRTQWDTVGNSGHSRQGSRSGPSRGAVHQLAHGRARGPPLSTLFAGCAAPGASPVCGQRHRDALEGGATSASCSSASARLKYFLLRSSFRGLQGAAAA